MAVLTVTEKDFSLHNIGQPLVLSVKPMASPTQSA
jgi:hypothetical protein